jgi:hypothetical protein
MQKIRILLPITLLTLIISCKKGSQNIDKELPPVESHGDSIIFKSKPHPQKITEDPNDNYLFGDSVWIPKECTLVAIGLDVLNTGGYTAKCKFTVNEAEIETRGIPKYDTVLNTGDSVFIFRDTVELVKGWNFIKFTGTTRSPASIYFSLHKEHLEFINTGAPVIGLPLKIKRDWN